MTALMNFFINMKFFEILADQDILLKINAISNLYNFDFNIKTNTTIMIKKLNKIGAKIIYVNKIK
jgi:hypothetical protein